MPMITLPSVCDRAAAAALYPELAESLGPAPLAVDAGRVERVGQAMLQLLVSAARSEGGIQVQQPSAAFTAALRLTGLEHVLMEGVAP
jgi:anti-anti-sigma regulatory factor